MFKTNTYESTDTLTTSVEVDWDITRTEKHNVPLVVSWYDWSFIEFYEWKIEDEEWVMQHIDHFTQLNFKSDIVNEYIDFNLSSYTDMWWTEDFLREHYQLIVDNLNEEDLYNCLSYLEDWNHRDILTRENLFNDLLLDEVLKQEKNM